MGIKDQQGGREIIQDVVKCVDTEKLVNTEYLRQRAWTLGSDWGYEWKLRGKVRSRVLSVFVICLVANKASHPF